MKRWWVILALAVPLFELGCATSAGDLSQNIALVSNVPAPSRPAEPARSPEFPAIALLWERSADPNQPAYVPADTAIARATERPEEPLPTPENLPPAPPVKSGTAKVTDFNEAANRATSRVQIDDYDDDGILLSLRQQLKNDPELAELKPVWSNKIDESVTRANKLRRLRLVLEDLKKAYAKATLNKETSLYDNIDMVSCRKAFAMLFERFADDAEIEVNIAPVGKKPLPSFNELCEFSHQASLAGVVFPDSKGKKKLRKLARRQYKATYPDVKLRKISVTDEKWTIDSSGDRRELRFTVGIERENAFPKDPCVMQELTIFQNKIGKRFRATECCAVRKETPILCELLE